MGGRPKCLCPGAAILGEGESDLGLLSPPMEKKAVPPLGLLLPALLQPVGLRLVHRMPVVRSSGMRGTKGVFEEPFGLPCLDPLPGALCNEALETG